MNHVVLLLLSFEYPHNFRAAHDDKFEATPDLTFRHRASCILGQAFRYSPENAFYIFNQ